MLLNQGMTPLKANEKHLFTISICRKFTHKKAPDLLQNYSGKKETKECQLRTFLSLSEVHQKVRRVKMNNQLKKCLNLKKLKQESKLNKNIC